MGIDTQLSPEQTAQHVRQSLPDGGLFAGHQWRIATRPFPLDKKTVRQLEQLGRLLLKFYQAANTIYHWSAEGRLPTWPSAWLDRGKPQSIIDLQRSKAFRAELPRVIRPDILLTEDGLQITELDSVPGGIGLTAWLNRTYAGACAEVVGGATGMLEGFTGIFGDAANVRLIVSDESTTYRPEMEWLVAQLGHGFSVHGQNEASFADGDAVYRFFELFDLLNIPAAKPLFDAAATKRIRVTPPPKAFLEEKMLFALFHNRNLADAWRQLLGERFQRTLKALLPQTWVIDPAPLPPHAALPGLDLTDWKQLKELSQKERSLILKISGFSEQAWGARGVWLGSDLRSDEWAAAVDQAITSFEKSPRILQRYHHPARVEAEWFDFELGQAKPMQGRVRLCPYYFVHGEFDTAKATLGGVLATICPADKKIIHGMSDAILSPCALDQTHSQ
ncbi:MAG: hypothetical protein QF721_03185 [Verrucomicrobiota bacterium]|jgi:hypothetical protein|nr:hypothetical protein [Verrucomicrobiota bacterium]MDP7048432.1 hypothetical protein [Verrucomicrobiota bacterium]